jgi:Zn-dependent protease
MEMVALSTGGVSHCPDCGHELPLGVLVCPECHVLVHGVDLTRLSAEARQLEAQGRFAEAREVWNRSLALLPPDLKQTEWVRGKIASLERAHYEAASAPPQSSHVWAKRLGPLAPLAIVLAKGKGLLLAIFKLKFLFSFFSFIAVYVAFWGWKFGAGFAVCILIHELGHYVDIRRRGLPAEMPVFLPGLGAYVKWDALGVTRRQIAEISLAGPLAGWMAAAGCLWLYTMTGNFLWVALAHTGAVINLLNLIPVWQLDGGKAIESLSKNERVALLVAAIAIGVLARQGIFILIAGGAAYRLFTKDKPKREDWRSLAYYIAVMALLALVVWVSPHGKIPGMAR